jgi:hypothetical protein
MKLLGYNFFSCRGKKVQPGSQIHKLQIFTQAGRWSDFAISKVKLDTAMTASNLYSENKLESLQNLGLLSLL